MYRAVSQMCPRRSPTADEKSPIHNLLPFQGYVKGQGPGTRLA